MYQALGISPLAGDEFRRLIRQHEPAFRGFIEAVLLGGEGVAAGFTMLVNDPYLCEELHKASNAPSHVHPVCAAALAIGATQESIGVEAMIDIISEEMLPLLNPRAGESIQ